MKFKHIIIKSHDWEIIPFHKKIQHICKNITSDYSIYVDKLKVKDIVKELCPNIKIAKIIRIFDNYNDVIESDINVNYIIKSSHASRWNINIKNNNMSINQIKEKLKSFDKVYNNGNEKQYINIKPIFFTEEKINDKYYGNNGDAISYNFYCLYGKIQMMRIDDPTNNYTNTYDSNWNLLSENYMNFIFEKPSNLNEITKMVTILASSFEFVRVDLFIGLNDDIYFGEFTFTSNGGNPFTTPIDCWFVDVWKK